MYFPPTDKLKNRKAYWLVTNFRSFFKTSQTILNQIYDVQNAEYIEHEDYTERFKKIAERITGEVAKNIKDGKREWEDNAASNAIFTNRYAVGQFTGMKSPQANDFYSDNNKNMESDFNNVTLIKCLFQIAMLGSVYATDWKFYTLSNAALFVNLVGNNLKFTGKFWYTPYNKLKDEDPREIITIDNIVNRILLRIQSNEELGKKIKEEISITNNSPEVWTLLKKEDFVQTIRQENTELFDTDKDLKDRELKASLELSQKLFLSTAGLESYLKENFALAFSGILGHTWDILLRFFEPNDNKKLTADEIEDARKKSSNFYFLKHLGTPIASYLFDLKDDTIQNDALQGYNSLHFGRIINDNLMTLSDRLKNTTNYKPQNVPNCLIPITFAPTLLQCRTKCYRNYKTLLKILKTRKQRDYLFEQLTQYGRRAMTVLDPYGIFMFFHKDLKGIPGN
jgi:hypothetical protein